MKFRMNFSDSCPKCQKPVIKLAMQFNDDGTVTETFVCDTCGPVWKETSGQMKLKGL
jgi:protein-arginine kinase activator protein McsA